MLAPSAIRVLLTEGSSLTARETISVLGPRGYQLEVMSPDPVCIARWSRWVRHVHRSPPAAADPVGYLQAVDEVVRSRRIEVLLPTHEHAWLLAAAGGRTPRRTGLAVAAPEAFACVQGKIAFARLLDRLELPQPEWVLVRDESALPDWPYPYFLKAPFSTAGLGVHRVAGPGQARRALVTLGTDGEHPVMAQRAATGRYAQVQVVADRGTVVLAHTSAQTAAGVGQSAAGRVSVDHPMPRDHAALICRELEWHGGLTLDYFYDGDAISYLECNPRMVEPANAARSGLDLPGELIRLSLAAPSPSPSLARLPAPGGTGWGRTGVRTHSTLAVLLGTAERTGSRRKVVADLVRLVARTGAFRGSTEALTPVVHDPPSLVPVVAVLAQLLVGPGRAGRLAAASVANYSVTEDAVAAVRGGGEPPGA